MSNLIMSYQIDKSGLINCANNNSLKGSWLYDLACKYVKNPDQKIFYIGMDNKKRIEIGINIGLFEKIKVDPLFIMKAEHLRRLRSSKEGTDILEHLCFPYYSFDNDLDKPT